MNKCIALCLLPWLLTGCKELPGPLAELQHIRWMLPVAKELPVTEETSEAVTSEVVDTKPLASPVKEISTAGLTAWLVEDHSLPLVSVQLVFKGAGSSSDPEDKTGRAMFAAALLDEGAGDLDALSFQQALEDKAIQLSFGVDEDVLVVNLRTLSEHLPEAFRLIGLALNQPRFDIQDIKRKRASALSRLRESKTKPGFVLAKTFNAMAYPDHPYSAQPLGSEASLSHMAQSDLERYVNQVLTKDRLLISVTGDVKADRLTELMETHLGALSETSLMPEPESITLKHQGVMVVEELDIPQSHVLVATPTIARDDERFMAAFVLNHIIGGDTFTSVLGSAIREEKGLAYSVMSYLDPMSHSSAFKVRFATRNEEAHVAYETLKAELTKVAEAGVSEEQFNNAIDYITGSFILSLDNNTNYTRYLGTMQRFDLGKEYLQTRNQKMRQVTREQVNELAKDMFDPDKWLTVVVGKPDKLESGPKASQ